MFSYYPILSHLTRDISTYQIAADRVTGHFDSALYAGDASSCVVDFVDDLVPPKPPRNDNGTPISEHTRIVVVVVVLAVVAAAVMVLVVIKVETNRCFSHPGRIRCKTDPRDAMVEKP